MPDDTILIGYLPKRIVRETDYVGAPPLPGVEEILQRQRVYLQVTARLGRLLAAQHRHLAVRRPGIGLVGGAGNGT